MTYKNAHTPASGSPAIQVVNFSKDTPILSLSRMGIFSGLLSTFGSLLIISLIQDSFFYNPAGGDLTGKIWRLDVDAEQSVYTWLSSSLMLVISGTLLVTALEKHAGRQPLTAHWLLLSLVFLLLSLDEAISLHEWLSTYLDGKVSKGGLLYFIWVLPAAIACTVGAIAYLPFIRDFGNPERSLLIVAAVTFLAGAIGLEMVAGAQVEQGQLLTMRYRVLTTVEEGLEGLGLIIFLYSLTLYRERRTTGIILRVG
jgi:hypothetical protein